MASSRLTSSMSPRSSDTPFISLTSGGNIALNKLTTLRATLEDYFTQVLTRLDRVEALQSEMNNALIGQKVSKPIFSSSCGERVSKVSGKRDSIGSLRSDSRERIPVQSSDTDFKPPESDYLFLVKSDEDRSQRNDGLSNLAGSSISKLASTQYWLRHLWKNTWFEFALAMVVASNAVMIGVQTEYAAESLSDDPPCWLSNTLLAYTVVFAVEISLRIASGVRVFFLGVEWRWNWLDSVIVLLSILDEIVSRIPDESSAFQGKFRMFGILRLSRLVRLVRITRLIRVIRSLRTLVHQILSTVKSLVWALILLTLIIFLFASVFTQAVTSFLIISAHDESSTQETQKLQQYFGNLPRSMLTLFEVLTNGLDWGQAIESLKVVGETYMCLFLVYVAFTQFAVFNVITGVFCQTAIDSAEHDQELVAQSVMANEQKFADELQRIFYDMDSTGSGEITIQQFRQHFYNPQLRAYFASLDVDTSDVWTLFKLLGKQNSNAIDVEAFVSGIVRIKGKAKAIDLARLSYEHKWMASQLSNFVTRTDLTLALLRNSLCQTRPRHSNASTIESSDEMKTIAQI